MGQWPGAVHGMKQRARYETADLRAGKNLPGLPGNNYRRTRAASALHGTKTLVTA